MAPRGLEQGVLTEPLLVTKLVLEQYRPEAREQSSQPAEPTPEQVVTKLHRQVAEMIRSASQNHWLEQSGLHESTVASGHLLSGSETQLDGIAAMPGDSAQLPRDFESQAEVSVSRALNQHYEEAMLGQSRQMHYFAAQQSSHPGSHQFPYELDRDEYHRDYQLGSPLSWHLDHSNELLEQDRAIDRVGSQAHTHNERQWQTTQHPNTHFENGDELRATQATHVFPREQHYQMA